mgnify:CR=1 FL=1
MADLPHVSFLGFETLLQRIDLEALEMAPTERARWRVVDRRGVVWGERTDHLDREGKRPVLKVDEQLRGRSDDRLRITAELELAAEAPFSVRSWQAVSVVHDAHGQPNPRTRRLGGGRVKGTELRWQGSARPPIPLHDRLVCASWARWLLAEHDATLAAPPLRVVDELHGVGSLAPRVRWQACGKAVLHGVTLRGWRTFGPASPPHHIWTGPGGAALMVLGPTRAEVRARLLGGRP